MIKDLRLKIKDFIIRKSEGFTLIELLVVIVIIGVLSTLIMVNFSGIRARARDGQRKGDLKAIQSALEIYRADQGTYPSKARFPANCGDSLKSQDDKSTYMQKVSCDPLGGGYDYEPVNNDTTYTIIACLENENDDQLDKSNGNPVLCNGYTNRWKLTVQNP